jgi:hypothetical protein
VSVIGVGSAIPSRWVSEVALHGQLGGETSAPAYGGMSRSLSMAHRHRIVKLLRSGARHRSRHRAAGKRFF